MHPLRSLSLLALAVATSLLQALPAEQKISNPDVGPQPYRLGTSVAMRGNRMIAGAPQTEFPDGGSSGACWVYAVTTPGDWALDGVLRASDPSSIAGFGSEVAIDGEYAVVGAPGASNGNGASSGAAYVFRRQNGTWTQQAKLLSLDGNTGHQFGSAVAIEGDVVVVGAPEGNDGQRGAAYVFTRTGDQWAQSAKLQVSTVSFVDFGSDVSISGDTILVGARFGIGNANAFTGAAYVFTGGGGSWTEQQKLTASDGIEQDYFGDAVSVSGDIAVIGAPRESNAGGSQAGSVYVYQRSGGVWGDQVKLLSPNGTASARFGTSVSLTGSRIAVGAPQAASAGTSLAGSVAFFGNAGGSWAFEGEISPDPAAASRGFGTEVSVSGEFGVVGAPFPLFESTSVLGSLFPIRRDSGEWELSPELAPARAAGEDRFGSRVAIAGDLAFAGAPGDVTTGNLSTGSVRVLRLDQGGFEEARLVSPSGTKGDGFGRGLAASVQGASTVVAIGAPFDDTIGLDRGAVFLFEGTSFSSSQVGTRLAVASVTSEEFFGSAISIESGTMVVGAPGYDKPPGGSLGEDAGTAYVFAYDGTNWVQQAKLTPSDGFAFDGFGSAVQAAGDWVFIGAPANDDGATDNGTVYCYRREGDAWALAQNLKGATVSFGDNFGSALAFSTDLQILAVCEPDDSTLGVGDGSVQLFSFDGELWQPGQILSSDLAGASLGTSVAFCGNTHLVTTGASTLAAAHLFVRNGTNWTYLRPVPPGSVLSSNLDGLVVAGRPGNFLLGFPSDDDPEFESGSLLLGEPSAPATPSPSPSPTQAPTASPTASRSPTASPTMSPIPTASPTITPAATASPSATPSATASPSATTPATPSASPSVSPVPSPTFGPTPVPPCEVILVSPTSGAPLLPPYTFTWTVAGDCEPTELIFCNTPTPGLQGPCFSVPCSGTSVTLTQQQFAELLAALGYPSTIYWCVGGTGSGGPVPWCAFTGIPVPPGTGQPCGCGNCAVSLLQPTAGAYAPLNSSFTWETVGTCGAQVLLFSNSPSGQPAYEWPVTGSSAALTASLLSGLNRQFANPAVLWWTIGVRLPGGEVRVAGGGFRRVVLLPGAGCTIGGLLPEPGASLSLPQFFSWDPVGACSDLSIAFFRYRNPQLGDTYVTFPAPDGAFTLDRRERDLVAVRLGFPAQLYWGICRTTAEGRVEEFLTPLAPLTAGELCSDGNSDGVFDAADVLSCPGALGPLMGLTP